jgi:hypothetical protein
MGLTTALGLSGGKSSGIRRATIAALAAGVVLAAGAPAASSAPPLHGVFEPGVSLGGIRLEMTKAQVKRLWGQTFGRCRSCLQETWYFNYRPFEPQGAGVTFVRGRVVSVFTVWQPEGWRTSGGLALGASQGEITEELGSLERRRCSGYQALVLPAVGVRSVFYVYDGSLWGFALMRTTLSPC